MGHPKGLSTRVQDKQFIYRLYQTDIVIVDAVNSYIKLNSGTWRTKHTKKCINLALEPFDLKVVQKDFEWYIVSKSSIVPFVDGIEVNI